MKTKRTPESFRDELDRFREVMCSTNFTLAEKEEAFDGLAEGYVCLPESAKTERFLFEMASEEFVRRSVYEIFRPLHRPALAR